MIAPAEAIATPGASVMVDVGHLAPMMIVAFWALLHLLTDAFAGPGMRVFQRRLALVGVGLAAAAVASQFGNWEYDAGLEVFSGFLIVDQFSLLLDLGILMVAGAVIMFAGDFARAHRFEYGEQESLILIAAFGMMILAHSADLIAIFLGIETMSIAVYVLVGAQWNSRRSSEAALKYFLMGAFASGLLLMGIALLYGATGSTALSEVHQGVMQVFNRWGAATGHVSAALSPNVPAGAEGDIRVSTDKAITALAPAMLFIPGMLLTLAGLLFKISAVPFHMWTPDAYDGAPSPTTGFMAAGVKIGGFAALLKVMIVVMSTQRLVTAPYGWTSAVALVAFLTMTVGNLAAVRQSNVKRLLAYSSIAHVGYILVGVVAAGNFYGHAFATTSLRPADQVLWSRTTGDFAVAAIIFYLLTYAVATLGTFACVSWFSNNKKEGTAVHEWSGLAERHPGMALGMTVSLLSLMGMPPLAGFFGKALIFRAAFENDNLVLRALVVIALLNAVIGAYYYLRLIVAMYFRPPPEREHPTLPGRGARIVVGASAALSIALGVGANPMLKRCELAASGFTLAPGTEQRAAWVDRLRERWETEDSQADAESDPPEGKDEPSEAKAPPGKAPEAGP